MGVTQGVVSVRVRQRILVLIVVQQLTRSELCRAVPVQ